MVEIIVNIVLEVVKCLAPPAERQFGYLRKSNYNANFKKLKDENGKLKDERTSIQDRVFVAQRNVEKIEEKVKKWLDGARNGIDGAEKLVTDEEIANKRCLKGLCPNLKTRYQLCKKAETEVKALVELLEEARGFDKISSPTIPEDIWLKSRKDYEAFESRLSILKSIRNALTDPNVSIIGVHGMGGVGKTTLVKEVARQAKEDMLFDQVVFSEVSQTIDIKKVQQEIAETLGLGLHEEAESRRASRLYERLKNEKKILVVLDNIWKPFELESVGIPSGDDHKGCKILLTARDRNVLSSLGSDHNFSIGTLSEEEAWRLFKMMAGSDVEKDALNSIATDVARACRGLPIALATIARALRRKSVPEWENALHELQKPSTTNFEGVAKGAYSSIELSYKYLEGEQLKQTFLLCSLITPAPVLVLFKYGMGIGLFQGVDKMEHAHNKLYALVHQLIDSCLLLEGGSSTRFSMHDVVRDVAISIACRDKNVFMVRNKDMWEWPDADTLKKCSAINLIDISICELPEGLECPQLEILHVQSKEPLLEINIPPNFFTGVRKIKVLDFTRMQLLLLPYSIEFLVNLQTLCLDQSKLGDIAIIGKLKNLEVLSLLESDILHLPKELGQLTKLRLLDLTNCIRLNVIAPNVISSLTRLEELYMANCFVEWEVEVRNGERSNASLAELMHLSRLSTLEINVQNDSILPEGFFERKLNRFKISVGDESFLTPPKSINEEVVFRISEPEFLITNYETLRTLKLQLNSATIGFSKKLQGIKNVEYLCFDKLEGLNNVVFQLDNEGFSQLKHLHVQNNPDFKCIVELMEMVPFDPFPLLETLTLYNLIKLERICHDQLRVHSFKELKTIIVKKCDALSNIFLLSAATCLPKLQRISVNDCMSTKVLFVVGGENDEIEKVEFPELRTLCLGNLPRLRSFCCGGKTSNRQVSYNEISLEDNLDNSTTLFNHNVVLPNLEVLEMYGINVEKIWHNQLPIMFPHFQSLTRLILYDCDKLKSIFSASMVQSFKQLQHLEIGYSDSMREIISEEGAGQIVTPSFVFPKLTHLELRMLPELRCLYPGMHTFECPALRVLVVIDCERVKLLTSESVSFERSNEKYQLEIPAQQPFFLFEKDDQILPNLEELGLDGKNIMTILQGNFPQHFFDCLKILCVFRDDSASFPLEILERFHNLEELEFGFNSYKEILSNGGPIMDNKHVEKLARIKRLTLHQLDDLKQLWKRDSRSDSVFQYLEILWVRYCQNLSILLPPSSVSFQNITELEALGCKGLKNLVTSSTAKGLVGLVRLKILGCRAMTEVIKSEEENEASKEEEIIFNKLKFLTLFDLQSLTSFCSADYIFKFPSLQFVNVIGCPNMSIFTTGESITPRMVEVCCDEKEEGLSYWEGDLNTTIQSLHETELLEGSSSYSTRY